MRNGLSISIGEEGLLSVVCYMNLINRIAPIYEEIQSLHQKVVELTIEYYQVTKHIAQSTQVWGRQFISELPVVDRLFCKPADLAFMHALVESGNIVPADGGEWDCMSSGCVKPQNKRTSYQN